MNFKLFLESQELYSQFTNYLKQNNIDFPQLLQQIQSQKPDGQGGNAHFYKIPNTPFGIRIVKRTWSDPDINPTLQPADNPHQDVNIGQPIAHYGKNVQVLRLQHGIPAGLKHTAWNFKGEELDKEVANYKNQIKTAAEMPLESYVELFNTILKLNATNHVVDPSKSGNLLIDKQNQKFNLVDINKINTSSNDYKNRADEISLMLLDKFITKYFLDDKEVQNYAGEILNKVEQASQITGLPLKKTYSWEFGKTYAAGKYKPYVPEPVSDNSASEVW